MGIECRRQGFRVCLAEKKRNEEEGEGGFILVITGQAREGTGPVVNRFFFLFFWTGFLYFAFGLKRKRAERLCSSQFSPVLHF